MRIALVAPDKPTSVSGNDVTAERWCAVLGELGHDVARAESWDGARADLLVALHARRSAGSVRRFAEQHPERPIVLALTGTDLYRDLEDSEPARRSIELADRLVVLQPLAVDRLPVAVRDRVHVVPQSVDADDVDPERVAAPDAFAVTVLAHLRPVKDPLLAARAVRRLPEDSRVQVHHAGAALDADLGERARRETAANPRYTWVGALPRARALARLAGADLMVLTSRVEGGANVVSEAIVLGVPIAATRIDGTVGMLGPDYPALVPVGDADALAELLVRLEADADGLYGRLRTRIAALRPRYARERERAAWSVVLDEAAPGV